MPHCMRCGREISAGRYCESCHFYVYNDQCWRCRMYLPRVELQQWRGQTYCPYCIQEIREEEVRAEDKNAENERRGGKDEDKQHFTPDEWPFGTGVKNDYTCDRCKNELDIVYIVADHKFCENCFHLQQLSWKEDNIDPPPYIKFRLKENQGLLARLLSFLKRKIWEEWKKRIKK